MSNSPLDTVVRHIRRVAMGTNGKKCTDAQLLQQFVSQRDEAAFTALVRRHERMVWQVCWHALGHVQDTEDAFQATFVVLAHSAAKIDKQEMLGSWLHGVALRISLKAKRDAARRRKHEREAANMPKKKQDSELSWREACQVLDEEVQRLPEKHRAAFVLCVLEEKSLAEAARLLNCKEGTVSGRLSRARKQLQDRLARREIRLPAVLASLALMSSTATASVPAGLPAATIQTALAFLARPDAAANILPANVAAFVQGAIRPMLSTKIKFAAVMFLAVNCGIAGVGLHAREQADARLPEAPPAAKRTSSKTDAALKPANDAEADTIVLSGRVLDPGDKPVEGAKLYLLDFADAKAPPKVQAVSDAEGRFRFTLARKDVQLPPYARNRWDHVSLCATAQGHGPALHSLAKPELGELTLHLVQDDTPIQGRVIDLQGKAVSGATVSVIGLCLPIQGDLSAFAEALKTSKDGYPAEHQFLTHADSPKVSRLFSTVSTDADGRFQIEGIGRERIAIVEISGPTIETRHLRVLTRPGQRMDRLEWKDGVSTGTLTYYGASFEHVAGPTTPILGVVRDKDTEKPLAGAIVTSWKLPNDNHQGRAFIRTTADKEGHYRLVGMPRGEGSMVNIMGPEGEPYLEVKRDVPAAQGLESVTVNAELKRGIWIKGRVTDKATGQPAPASVDYFAFKDNPYRKDAPDLEPRLHAKDDGTFQFVGLPGRGVLAARGYQDRYLVGVGSEQFKVRDAPASWRTLDTSPVRCMVDNFHTLVEVAPAEGAASLTCDITLDPGQTLTGTVVGPNGKPLAGARLAGVTGFTISSWERATQPTAEFTVYAVKAGQKRCVLAVHEQKQLAGSLMIEGDEKGPLTIPLKPWAVLSGRLVTHDGQPRRNAEVTLERYGARIKDPACGYHRQRSFQTDKDGKFRIDALVPGMKYTMHFKNNKGVLSGILFEDMTFQPAQMKDLGDLQVKD